MLNRLSTTISPNHFLAGVLALSALGCNKEPAQLDASPSIQVTVNDTACVPNTLEVPAGKSTFLITNASTRPLEWEILKDVLVVDERENIAPGLKVKMTVQLSAGEYQMTCGLLNNPRAKLVVTPNAQATDTASTEALLTLAEPIAAYKKYVLAESKELVKKTALFVAAIKSGNADKARGLFAPTRTHYERIEPIAELFADLDARIDARADAHKLLEQDPNFSGFHKLEYQLFQLKTTKESGKVADQLMADVQALHEQISALNFPANKVVGGAAALIEEVANGKISGEEDRYSGTDLSDFNANMEGAAKIVELFRPMIAQPELLKSIDARFSEVDLTLKKYYKNGVWQNYAKLNEIDRKTLQASITVLAEQLAQLRGLLKLD